MASHTNDGEFGFQIAPMLDVLFVLLLFFMVTAGLQKHEATLSAPMPGFGGPDTLVQMILGITDDGQVMFNGVPVDSSSDSHLPELTARLEAVLADSPNRPVIIQPAASARQQRVVDVLNACKAAAAKSVAFAPAS